MQTKLVALLALQAVSAVCTNRAAVTSSETTEVNTTTVPDTITEAYAQLAILNDNAFKTTMSLAAVYSAVGDSPCTPDKVRVRKEWGALTDTEKLNYIEAVQCLQTLPALTPESKAAGAKTRFDDFVATHINQTLTIHYTASFFSWHRRFIWLYENVLTDECGFTGDLPYWDWAITAETGLETSPIFDGSDLSMSGNGDYVANQDVIVLGDSLGLPPIYLPPGSGGGCVTTGPFVNMSVNLGPASLDMPGDVTASNPVGPLAYNPRCLKRDLTNAINQDYANATSILNTILAPQNAYDLGYAVQGVPGSGDLGIHAGGHYCIGGDPARDVFVSPGDPVFYLHHAQVDRVWWLWQMLDAEERQYGNTSLGGTLTFMDNPESRDGTFEDILEYGYAAGPEITVKEAMSTVAGDFCYVYV